MVIEEKLLVLSWKNAKFSVKQHIFHSEIQASYFRLII